jgi:predicted transcriptional regulator
MGTKFLQLAHNDRLLASRLKGCHGWVWLEVLAHQGKPVLVEQVAEPLGLTQFTAGAALKQLKRLGLLREARDEWGWRVYLPVRDAALQADLMAQMGIPKSGEISNETYWSRPVAVSHVARHQAAKLPGGIGWVYLSLLCAPRTMRTTEAIRQDVGFTTRERVQRSLRTLRAQNLVTPRGTLAAITQVNGVI